MASSFIMSRKTAMFDLDAELHRHHYNTIKPANYV
jgi:hypothetical protein